MKLSDHVLYREYNGKTLIRHIKNNLCFVVNASASFILDLMKTETSPEIIKNTLINLYPDVSEDTISNDVDLITNFVTTNNLIETNNITYEHTVSAYPMHESIQKYTINENIFYTAMFELTYRCPEKCIHCYLEPDSNLTHFKYSADDELSTEEIFNLIDQLYELNVMEITFTGGEPFSRKDFIDILKYTHQKGFAINIYSNALLINDEIISILKTMNILSFHVSLYSHIPHEHDSITRIEGSFNKTFENLKKLSKEGIHLIIKFVLMERNKDSFEGVISLSHEINASIRLISCVNPTSSGDCSICSLNVKEFEALVNIIKMYDQEIGYTGPTTGFSEKHSICEAGHNNLTIRPNGTVTPCNALDFELGNTRQMSLKDIWNSSILKEWQSYTKEKLTECKDCNYASLCSFCPGCALHYSNNMFKKYDEACRQARAQYDALKNIN